MLTSPEQLVVLLIMVDSLVFSNFSPSFLSFSWVFFLVPCLLLTSVALFSLLASAYVQLDLLLALVSTTLFVIFRLPFCCCSQSLEFSVFILKPLSLLTSKLFFFGMPSSMLLSFRSSSYTLSNLQNVRSPWTGLQILPQHPSGGGGPEKMLASSAFAGRPEK